MIPITSGTRLGTYEVLSAIGEGGMGAVYRARDTGLNREVAIKVLLPSVAGDPERLSRFSREAQVLASLNHPNIAAIYGLEEAGGVKALVLELVEGPTLADRIAKGPIALDEALVIAGQIADALEAAHEQGIVHRDLKPANVKIRPDGTVKVLDFGLAKAVDPVAASSGSLTMSPAIATDATIAGVILGTVPYMSPEQASGKPVDRRADIWAFGVVLWEMLTGRQMFEGETISHVLAAVLTKEPDLTAAPPRVRVLLGRCLEKDPKRRLRHIGDAMSLLQTDAPPIHVDTPPRRWRGLGGWIAAGVLGVALVVAVWQRPFGAGDLDQAVVRFQIERSSLDPYGGTAAAFAVSPDGRFLAYYDAGRDGEPTLFLRALATGERRDVPGSAILSPVVPFWSPDTRQLVYATSAGAQVLDISARTTSLLCACRFRGGSWSRDGVILLGESTAVSDGLRRLSLTNRTPNAITGAGAAEVEQDTYPAFFPDGRRFFFTRAAGGSGPSIYLGSLDGDPPQRVGDGSSSRFVASVNAAGPQMLAVEGAGLVARAFDPRTLTASGDARTIVGGAVAASVSDNGVLATSAAGSRPFKVPTWYDRKGTVLGAIGEPRPIESVALTSDGRRIALTEVASPGTGAVWLRDLVTGLYRRMTFNVEQAVGGTWSPDGTRIVFSARRDGIINLYQRASDGTGEETVLFPADRNTHVNDWSRDGRWLIYTIPNSEKDTDLDLWVFAMDAGADRKPAPYLATAAREAQGEFSPDGKYVAYISDESGTQEVYVQPFPKASDGKWMVSSGGGVEPRWSRDGKELFYFKGKTLMAVPVVLSPTFANGSPVRLFDAPVQPGYINDSDRWQVAADGTRFLLLPVSLNAAVPPIDVVVNWPTLLRK